MCCEMPFCFCVSVLSKVGVLMTSEDDKIPEEDNTQFIKNTFSKT